MRSSLLGVAALGFALLAGCSGGDDGATHFDVADRAATDRTPLTSSCDPLDPTRCLLPWPSSAFTVADAHTATGLRVHVDPSQLLPNDDATMLNTADGFSRVTPIVTAFAGTIADVPVEADGAGPVRLLLAQHDDPDRGSAVALRVAVQRGDSDDGTPESFVFGYPLRPLKSNADYVAVVLDSLPVQEGAAPKATHATRVALGLDAPATLDEAKLAAWHAPTRELLAKAGVAPEHVLRVWAFTTRSEQDPLARLDAMRKAALDAVAKGTIGVTITSIDTSAPPPVAAVVEGKLTGIPAFVGKDKDALPTLAADGSFVASGTREAPFRVVIPTGNGDYPFVMYGHGLGGTFHDGTLDAQIAGAGIAKVGIQWDGWTADDVPDTFVGLTHVFRGVSHGVAELMQALEDASAVEAAMPGVLGDALASATLAGAKNPAAGRRPDASNVMWVGGSLGGTEGLVGAALQPDVRYGVLNVPGAAWTHFVWQSKIFDEIEPLLRVSYGSLDLLHALAMTQGQWDEVDGAAWSVRLAGRKGAFLVQESIGDPVLSNAGNEMVAVVTDAKQVGGVIVPIAAGIPKADEVDGASGITQYRVPSTDPFAIHGFAGGDTPAGVAARQQIADFVTSALAGAPKITVPASCPGGTCDFAK